MQEKVVKRTGPAQDDNDTVIWLASHVNVALLMIKLTSRKKKVLKSQLKDAALLMKINQIETSSCTRMVVSD